MINLLIVGVSFFVIAAIVVTYFMYGYSAMLEDIDAQDYDSKANILS